MSIARLDALAAALKKLPAALNTTVVEVVRDNAYILELDNQQQLEEGLDANGRDITPEYTFFTIEEKEKKGQPTDRVTLKDKGDFYRGIVARVRGESVEMVGTDSKTQELQQKYGDAVLGLSEEAVDDFRQTHVQPELEYKIRQVLGV
jgi:hypothetical protein